MPKPGVYIGLSRPPVVFARLWWWIPCQGRIPPRYVVYVGDTEANVYALDARTGKQLWKVDVDDHPLATITGTPKTHGNRIYVSTTALEEVAGSDPQYECCTFRGKLMALNRFNGKLVWTGYTLPDPPAPVRKNAIGTQLWGPSGASIWSSPALDPERNRIYAATGDNYSDPALPHERCRGCFRYAYRQTAVVKTVHRG